MICAKIAGIIQKKIQAIKLKQKIGKKELNRISNELADLLDNDIDLIDLDEIGDTFRYEILANGKILYTENEFNFEMYKQDK